MAFSVSDLLDFDSLAGKLTANPKYDGPLTAFLEAELDDGCKSLLSSYNSSKSHIKAAAAAVVLNLNRIIQGPPIYSDARFGKVKLRPETESLRRSLPQGLDLARLNRLLLEDAFPVELSRISGNGDFYLLPSDDHQEDYPNWDDPSQGTLQRCISGSELSSCLRRIVARHFVLIIDACQSAGVVGPDFRPAPLGQRSLGQLAYDKGMIILTACQTDQAAREIGQQVNHGALTYVLLNKCLEGPAPSTDAENQKERLTLQQWLHFPVQKLSTIFGTAQKPVLFDYEQRRSANDEFILKGSREMINH